MKGASTNIRNNEENVNGISSKRRCAINTTNNNNNRQAQCKVCFESGNSKRLGNIITCLYCHVSVHINCYGAIDIQTDSENKKTIQFCNRCLDAPPNVKCCFCQGKDGAFKPVHPDKQAHLVCGIWIDETYIEDLKHMQPILGFECIPTELQNLRCIFCKSPSSKPSVCIQCSDEQCHKSFHPICAYNYGGKLMQYEWIDEDSIDATLHPFCPNHAVDPISNKKHIDRNIQFDLSETSIINKQYLNLKNKETIIIDDSERIVPISNNSNIEKSHLFVKHKIPIDVHNSNVSKTKIHTFLSTPNREENLLFTVKNKNDKTTNSSISENETKNQIAKSKTSTFLINNNRLNFNKKPIKKSQIPPPPLLQSSKSIFNNSSSIENKSNSTSKKIENHSQNNKINHQNEMNIDTVVCDAIKIDLCSVCNVKQNWKFNPLIKCFVCRSKTHEFCCVNDNRTHFVCYKCHVGTDKPDQKSKKSLLFGYVATDKKCSLCIQEITETQIIKCYSQNCSYKIHKKCNDIVQLKIYKFNRIQGGKSIRYICYNHSSLVELVRKPDFCSRLYCGMFPCPQRWYSCHTCYPKSDLSEKSYVRDGFCEKCFSIHSKQPNCSVYLASEMINGICSGIDCGFTEDNFVENFGKLKDQPIVIDSDNEEDIHSIDRDSGIILDFSPVRNRISENIYKRICNYCKKKNFGRKETLIKHLEEHESEILNSITSEEWTILQKANISNQLRLRTLIESISMNNL